MFSPAKVIFYDFPSKVEVTLYEVIEHLFRCSRNGLTLQMCSCCFILKTLGYAANVSVEHELSTASITRLGIRTRKILMSSMDLI